MLLIFLVTQVIFVCIFCHYCHILTLWNTINMLFIRGMEVYRAQYNMRHYSKHEILLLDTCLLYLYFPPDRVVNYLCTYHNIITHISIVVDHYIYRYRDTVLPCPYLLWYFKYENYEVVLNSYRFQQ